MKPELYLNATEELSILIGMTELETFVFMRLRIWSALYSGFNTSASKLPHLRRQLGVTPRKFEQDWEVLRPMFTEVTPDHWIYQPDEDNRIGAGEVR